MPVEVIIHTLEHSKALKGTIQTARDVSKLVEHPWGAREGLPNYVRLRITDATESQVLNYLDSWQREIAFDLVGQNAAGRRYQMSINPKIITEFGEADGLKVEIKDYLVNDYGANFISWDPSVGVAVVDVPNTNWSELAADIVDKFRTTLSNRRYYFEPGDVDLAVAAGGYVELNTNQVLNRIIDRLA
jgi:hypothetical protein